MAEVQYQASYGDGGYQNRAYLTSDRVRHASDPRALAQDVGYPDGRGAYTMEYRTEKRVVETRPSQQYSVEVDLSSPFALSAEQQYGYQGPRSPGIGSTSSRQRMYSGTRLQEQEAPDAYVNLPGSYQQTTVRTHLGSMSNVSGQKSPGYANGGHGGYGGYSVTREQRVGRLPSQSDQRSFHGSQSAGIDYGLRYEQQQQQQQQQQLQLQQQQPQVGYEQHQYVNYSELDNADGGRTTLSRSDKFGTLGSQNLSGSNTRLAARGSLGGGSLHSQRSGGGGGGGGGSVGRGGGGGSGGGGGGFGLSVRDIDISEEQTMRQEVRQQMTSQQTTQHTRTVETSQEGGDGFAFKDPDMNDLVNYLRNGDQLTVLNTSACLQHLTFENNDCKVEFHDLGGLQELMRLLQASDNQQLQQNLLGILRNLSFRSRDANLKVQRTADAERQLLASLEAIKRELCRLGVLKELREIVANSRDDESRELACAVMWNLSSSQALKMDVIDACVPTLAARVLLPHSGLELRGDAYVSVHRELYGSYLFYLASGVVRSVSSHQSLPARDHLRRTEGLVDCLMWMLLAAQAGQQDMNNDCLENCLCAVRNLTFACQEVADPDYLQRGADRNGGKGPGSGGCFSCRSGGGGGGGGGGGAKSSKSSKAASGDGDAPVLQYRPAEPLRGMDRLWHAADLAPLLLHVLDTCDRAYMLEAAAGAAQNLSACSWQPAVEFRQLFRRGGGLLLLSQLVAKLPPPYWAAVPTIATAYRNVAMDAEASEVTAEHARLLASALPGQRTPAPELRRDDAYTSVIAALYVLLKRNPGLAEELFACGCVDSLVYISDTELRFSPKVASFADTLLGSLWSVKENQQRLQDKGWTESAAKQRKKKASAKQPEPAVRRGDGLAAGGGGGAGHDNAAYQRHDNAAYMYQRQPAEAPGGNEEPQYAQVNKRQQPQQQQQQQQPAADSWV